MSDTTKNDGIITLTDDTISPEIEAAAKEARRRMRLANMCMALMFPSEDDVDFYAKGPMPNLQRVLADLGCLHRVGRDENGNLQSDFPMLIRGILHPCEPMPLDVVANGRLAMIDRLPCRAVFLTKPLLWVPGMVLSVQPMAASVMGQPLTPRDTLQHYATGNLLDTPQELSTATRSAHKTYFPGQVVEDKARLRVGVDQGRTGNVNALALLARKTRG